MIRLSEEFYCEVGCATALPVTRVWSVAICAALIRLALDKDVIGGSLWKGS
jgi:hypothetical protein